MYLETNVADVMSQILPAFEAVVRHYISRSTQPKILEFYSSQVPLERREHMQPHELCDMIIGDPDVDVERWKSLSSGDFSDDIVVQWFWEYMESCPSEDRLRVLQWTTGYSRLPSESRAKY